MERTKLIGRLLEQQKGLCFICEKPLDHLLDRIDVDHIVPKARGGKDDENNYAATHESCNRSKLDSDLRVARCMATYEKLKEAHADKGPNRPNLGDFLAAYGGGRFPLRVDLANGLLTYTTPDRNPTRYQVPVYRDKLSGLKYAFLHLPIDYIFHDDRINPRAVSPRLRGLISEFLIGRPQLHVALAWGAIEGDTLKVRVFDGQHKVVAQILLGVSEFPVRLFVDPDVNLLLETNTNAGTALRQVAFDQATQRFLGSQLYWEKIDTYRQATGRSDDNLSFSEQDLVKFFRGEQREISRYILDDVRISVIYHQDNRLRDYIEFSGRETEKPLSYSTVEKTVFSLFIRKAPLSLPLDHKMEVGENKRQIEKEQIVRLLNILAAGFYIGSYDTDIGASKVEERLRKGDDIPGPHLRAVRVSREEILFNLLCYVRDLVKRYFLMQGQVIDYSELFQNKFPPALWDLLDKLVTSLADLPVWVNKPLSGTVFGGKRDHEYWKTIFESGRDRSGAQVLAKPLNLDDLVNR